MAKQEEALINRVAQSSLVTIKLEKFYPEQEVIGFDMKDYLFKGLILKEKDFRQALKEHDWSEYRSKYLAVFCSTDAIIPVWAYMLVGVYAAPVCKDIYFGDTEVFLQKFFQKAIEGLDISTYTGQKVIIKGCHEKPVPVSAYLDVTRKLLPVASSIMYGEACSTVPIFKKSR